MAFAGIDLHKVGAGLTINAVASIMLAMYQAVAEKLGFDRTKISATPQNDILKEVLGRGAWIYALEPAVKLIGDTIEYSMTVLPRTNPVSRVRLPHPRVRRHARAGDGLRLLDRERLHRRGGRTRL